MTILPQGSPYIHVQESLTPGLFAVIPHRVHCGTITKWDSPKVFTTHKPILLAPVHAAILTLVIG